MSVQQDRLTFYCVLIAVVVVVLGYLQLGQIYPVSGRAEKPVRGDQTQQKEKEKEKEQGADERSENNAGPSSEDAAP